MSGARTFPTLDVVTVSTGVMVSDRGIGAVCEVCNYMLSDSLMTHQLPAASRACEASLHRQHPWLADLTPPADDLDALRAWCAALVAEHGDALPVTPVPAPERDWVAGNSLRDLLDMAPDIPVVIVDMGEKP